MLKGLSSMFNLAALKKSVQDVGSQVYDLRAQIEALRREREDVAGAPTARQDVKAAFRNWISDSTSLYTAQLRFTIDDLIRSPADLLLGRPLPITVTGASHQKIGGLNPRNGGVDFALCALFGSLLADAMDRQIDGMKWPEAEGLPVVERRERLAELDKRINDLVESERELLAAARSAGVIVDVGGLQ